jgi:hypothetical protein
MRIFMSPKFRKKAASALFLTALGLCLISFGVTALGFEALSQLTSRAFSNKVVETVNVNFEQNLPTWFSASVLLLNSVLLAAISSMKRAVGDKYVLHWRGLAVIFLILSMDEIVGVHNKSAKLLPSVLHTGGIFYYAWVIPGSVFVFFFLLAYLRFFRALPTRAKWLFFAAGGLYVRGVLGLEMFLGYLVSTEDGRAQLLFRVQETVEEFLEMTGAIVFFYALTGYCEGSLMCRMRKQSHPTNRVTDEYES